MATDRIPHELVRVMWKHFVKVMRLPDWALEVVHLSMGLMVFSYLPDDKGNFKKIKSLRGILMGLPFFWVTLNLL